MVGLLSVRPRSRLREIGLTKAGRRLIPRREMPQGRAAIALGWCSWRASSSTAGTACERPSGTCRRGRARSSLAAAEAARGDAGEDAVRPGRDDGESRADPRRCRRTASGSRRAHRRVPVRVRSRTCTPAKLRAHVRLKQWDSALRKPTSSSAAPNESRPHVSRERSRELGQYEDAAADYRDADRDQPASDDVAPLKLAERQSSARGRACEAIGC